MVLHIAFIISKQCNRSTQVVGQRKGVGRISCGVGVELGVSGTATTVVGGRESEARANRSEHTEQPRERETRTGKSAQAAN